MEARRRDGLRSLRFRPGSVVDHEHTPVKRSLGKDGADRAASARCFRARCRWAGRPRASAYHRNAWVEHAEERRAGGFVRASPTCSSSTGRMRSGSRHTGAATRIRETAVPAAQLALEGKATQLGNRLDDRGKDRRARADGRPPGACQARGRIPPGLVEVMHVPGLGPKTARKLWQELGSRASMTCVQRRRHIASRHRRALARNRRRRSSPRWRHATARR